MRSKLIARTLSLALLAVAAAVALATRVNGQNTSCPDRGSGKPADCVPATFTTFDIPFDKLPGGRMDAQGNLDPTSSPKDAHAGAFVAAKKLGLFRNFEWLHWVPTAPRWTRDGSMARRRPRRLSNRVGIDGSRHSRRLSVLGTQQFHQHHRPARDPRREDLQDSARSREEPAGRSRQDAPVHRGQRRNSRARPGTAPLQLHVHGRRRTDADGSQCRDRDGR